MLVRFVMLALALVAPAQAVTTSACPTPITHAYEPGVTSCNLSDFLDNSASLCGTDAPGWLCGDTIVVGPGEVPDSLINLGGTVDATGATCSAECPLYLEAETFAVEPHTPGVPGAGPPHPEAASEDALSTLTFVNRFFITSSGSASLPYDHVWVRGFVTTQFSLLAEGPYQGIVASHNLIADASLGLGVGSGVRQCLKLNDAEGAVVENNIVWNCGGGNAADAALILNHVTDSAVRYNTVQGSVDLATELPAVFGPSTGRKFGVDFDGIGADGLLATQDCCGTEVAFTRVEGMAITATGEGRAAAIKFQRCAPTNRFQVSHLLAELNEGEGVALYNGNYGVQVKESWVLANGGDGMRLTGGQTCEPSDGFTAEALCDGLDDDLDLDVDEGCEVEIHRDLHLVNNVVAHNLGAGVRLLHEPDTEVCEQVYNVRVQMNTIDQNGEAGLDLGGLRHPVRSSNLAIVQGNLVTDNGLDPVVSVPCPVILDNDNAFYGVGSLTACLGAGAVQADPEYAAASWSVQPSAELDYHINALGTSLVVDSVAASPVPRDIENTVRGTPADPGAYED